MQNTDLLKASRARGVAMATAACAKAQMSDPGFSGQAERHILSLLDECGSASGEELTDSCKHAGIVPHDDRAFGAVFSRMSRRGLIRPVGFCLRRKGHGTAGGRVWGKGLP